MPLFHKQTLNFGHFVILIVCDFPEQPSPSCLFTRTLQVSLCYNHKTREKCERGMGEGVPQQPVMRHAFSLRDQPHNGIA